MYLLKTMNYLFNETGLTWGTFLWELLNAVFLRRREGLGGIVRHHAEREPDKVAVICNTRSLTYSEVYSRAKSLASSLYELGLRQGDRIALYSQNALEIPEVSIGMNMLKLSSIPLNWHLKSEELNYILTDSECQSIIFQENLRQEVLNSGVNLKNKIVIGKACEGEIPYDSLLSKGNTDIDFARGDYPRTIIYTSGTTGKPKGAERRVATSFMIFVTTSVYEFGLKHSDVHLTVCPLYHSAPIVFMVLQLVLGATNIIMPKFNVEEMLAIIEKYKVTSTFIVPYVVIELLSQPDSVIKKYDLSSLKTVICAAAPLNPEHKMQFKKRFGNILYEFYGATETGINTILKPEDIDKKAQSVGKVLPYNRIKILDDKGNELPVNTPGEIYIKNPFLMNGYYKRYADTKRSMYKKYLTVGDVGKIDKDGFLYITDRKSDMVISGGVNIYPAEIENVLLNHPSVKYAAVIGIPDEKWGEKLKAFIVKRDGTNPSPEELVLYLRNHIASFKIPKDWEFVDSLPITPSGKILKRMLRDKYWRENKI